jgi:dihydrofolate reductase
MITLIAAIGRNNEIGLDNKLPWNIPEDLKHFKSYTLGKVVVMGRKTFESIGNKSLPGRKCIVISTQDLHGLAIRARDIKDVLSIEHCYPELVVIGGEMVYKQTIAIADKLVITHVDAEFEADKFFPVIDSAIWQINSRVKSYDNNHRYTFVEYIKKNNTEK